MNAVTFSTTMLAMKAMAAGVLAETNASAEVGGDCAAAASETEGDRRIITPTQHVPAHPAAGFMCTRPPDRRSLESPGSIALSLLNETRYASCSPSKTIATCLPAKRRIALRLEMSRFEAFPEREG